MTIKSKKELVEYLLRRRFGTLAPPPPSNLHLARPRLNNDNLILNPITEAKFELEGMSVEQLEELIKAAKQKDFDVLQAKKIADEQALFFHKPHAEADFTYWGKMAIWTIDEAIALSLKKNPEVVSVESVNDEGASYISEALMSSPFRNKYNQRTQIARRSIAAGELCDPIKSELFCKWAQCVFDQFPQELLEQVEARSGRIMDIERLTLRVAQLEGQSASHNDATKKKWPWGSHETKLLKDLEAAAERWWEKYDPTDPSTAPTNKMVIAWLHDERKVPKRMAAMMAQILRVDGLKPGPR
ncbi:MAG TPA: hypothetical protein VJP80_01635 [Candidatus Saccharimonadales bacterium]|nr:hypothetical protein [Candidatus Saccharimonadales bacterium]